MPCVSKVHFLSITDKSKAVDAGMSEEQMEEGKCMGHMPPRFGTSSEKAGTVAHEADAVL